MLQTTRVLGLTVAFSPIVIDATFVSLIFSAFTVLFAFVVFVHMLRSHLYNAGESYRFLCLSV